MDICETYSNRKLFCNDWEFYKAVFGSDYSERTLLSSLWTFLMIGLFIIQMTYMKLLLAGTERISLTKRKRAYALLSALTEFTWTARCM